MITKDYSTRFRALNMLLLAVLVLFFELPVIAQTRSAMANGAAKKVYEVADVPNPQLADRTAFVTDPSQVLSADAIFSINKRLYDLRTKTSSQVAVVILPSIGDNVLFNYAQELATTWGIGTKENDSGLLILMVMDIHKIRFHTGYGLEGDLPDAICKRIQIKAMTPYFKQGNWDQGMYNGVDAVANILDGTGSPEQWGRQQNEKSSSPILMFGLFFLFFITYSIISVFRRARCPKCNSLGQRIVNQSKKEGIDATITTITYVCPKCGHRYNKQIREHHQNNSNGGGGIFLGGLGAFGRGGSGGGGFGGGGFGGGSFGGGGASSGW